MYKVCSLNSSLTQMTGQDGTPVIPSVTNTPQVQDPFAMPLLDRHQPVMTSECIRAGDVLSLIGDKWGVMTLMLLQGGPLRFNALKALIGGVSQRMLSRTLRRLERDGLVTRTVYDFVPPRVEYALTSLGHSMCSPLTSLSRWVFENLDAIESARQTFDRHAAE